MKIPPRQLVEVAMSITAPLGSMRTAPKFPRNFPRTPFTASINSFAMCSKNPESLVLGTDHLVLSLRKFRNAILGSRLSINAGSSTLATFFMRLHNNQNAHLLGDSFTIGQTKLVAQALWQAREPSSPIRLTLWLFLQITGV